MKTLFEASTASELEGRIRRLTPESRPEWGAMTVGQMLAHCSAWMDMAAGRNTPPRSLAGRLFGRFAKQGFLGEAPIRKSLPTDNSLLVQDSRDFSVEQPRLLESLHGFSTAGEAGCTKHPHCFFGPLTPQEWAVMGYKHLDHHLQQFGV